MRSSSRTKAVGRDLLSSLRAKLRDESGFTLVELLYVMITFGVIFTAAFFFFLTTLSRTEDTEARLNTLADVRIASENVARDARESVNATVDPTGMTLSLSGPPAITGINTPVVYSCVASTGTCTRQLGSNAATTFATDLDLSTAPFTALAADYVRIQFTQIPEDRDSPISIDRGVTLRNYCTQEPEPTDCT